MALDTATDQGAKADQRLRGEEIIWLTTVRADGQPQPVPVWFLWDGESAFVASQAVAQKLRNIRGNRRVALNLHANESGGDVVRMEGTAELLPEGMPEPVLAEYLAKYRAGIGRIGLSAETFVEAYPTVLRITPERVNVW